MNSYTSWTFNVTIVPLVANAFFAATSIYNVDDFGIYPSFCYTTMFFSLAPSFATLIGFGYTHDLKPPATLLTLVAHGALLIIIFAGIYHGAGLHHGSEIDKPTSFWTAIYFSIITWTTVGYGDYAPMESIQMVAAVEALLGYVFFGTTVGLVTAILTSPKVKRPMVSHMETVTTEITTVEVQSSGLGRDNQ